MSYSSALNKINSVKNEVNDGANTAIRVGEAMRESLLFTKEETDKKPDTIDIAQYKEDGSVLPLGAHYTYYGNPTQTLAGYCQETDNDFIAICIYHWDDLSTIVLYVKDALDRYIYTSTFRSNEATNVLEQKVADLFGGMPVTYEQDGLMRAADKVVFDEMVTEVFPLTVAVASSNAGAYEAGDAQHAVTPQIVLSITRKGLNVPASEIMLSVSPNPASVSPDKRTISGNQIYSGTTAFQISVSQGGQTRSVPNQVFTFTNYRYKGVLSSKPNTSNIVAAIRALPKEFSTVATLGQTTLEAGKYYLFAVKGNHTLIVKNAKSGGVIDVPTSDKGIATVPQENGVGSNTYSWVIVPASSNTWYFQITNS